MDNPLISVIIPAYNASATIGRCLDSILSQHYEALEIIVVNDGSKDNTLQILEGYQRKDSRIQVISQQNAGVSAARNNALRHVHGQWITCIDADDYIEDGYFQTLLPLSENSEFSICGMTRILMNGETLRWELYSDASKSVAPKYECGVNMLVTQFNQYALTGPMCKLYSAEIVRDNDLRFPEDMSFGEDTVFVFTYLQHVKKVTVSETWLYGYVDGGSCLTRMATTEKRLLATHRIYDLSMSLCQKNNISDLDTVQYHYVDSIMQNVIGDSAMTREMRYICYDDIAKLSGTAAVRRCMPFYFPLFAKTSWWCLYEFVNRIIYHQTFEQ